MNIVTHIDKATLGAVAASEGAAAINAAIRNRSRANVILATGVSQYEMLDDLIGADIDWSRVTAFHLDEYVGLPVTHGASFRKYLRERVMDRLPAKPVFVEVAGDAADLGEEVRRLNRLITRHAIDVCFAGIGENGHLAFNDPPADFTTTDPYIVVTLDDACRRQQLGEGWFPDFDSVPQRAISMSVTQIMKSAKIILSVPDARKAEAVQRAVEGPVTPLCPASILQRHPNTTLHLDPASASALAA
ncbi:MAG TPA: glucosamine-6-phosphate deaminase [Devosia sp.]|mgnify:CR=1 FL=1|nr:glucosamine-6-phosphate deaminase [Devosia sp.]